MNEMEDEMEMHRVSTSAAAAFAERVETGSPRRPSAEVIQTYFTHRWLDDEAAAWARAGIDAASARVWSEFGVGPTTAERVVDSGRSLAQAIRACWDAGVPSEEFASYLERADWP